jgi:hypothetical protein
MSPIILTGPNQKSINILITPLSETAPELTLDEAESFFEGYTHRHNLEAIGSGLIRVAGKDHFWAKYYKMRLTRYTQFIMFKKYSLVFNGVEYLMTAVLGSAASGGKLPDDQGLLANEKVYDEIVTSFRLSNGQVP